MRLNLRNLKHFKEGVKNLTPVQQLDVTISSSIGSMIGLLIALAAMLYTLVTEFNWRMFGFTMVVIFFLPMQWVQYIKSKQQKQQLMNLEKVQEEFENV